MGYLSTVRKLDLAKTGRIVEKVIRSDAVVAVGAGWTEVYGERTPWKLAPSRRLADATIPGPLPERITLVLANRLLVEKRDLPPTLLTRLRRLAAFQNPEFFRAQQMRLSTFGKRRLIDCSEDMPAHLALPRGYLGAVLALGEVNGIVVSLTDERHSGSSLEAAFRGELTSQQQEAAEALAAHDAGFLCAPTGFSKTVIAAWLIAQREVSTLVVVHRQHLAVQWRGRLATFLDLGPSTIGQFGAARRRPTGVVDIALLQSLARKGEVENLVADYGQVIVDECHHVPAFSFERARAEVHARYVVGLTATPVRKDVHRPIIAMQRGPVRFTIDARQEAAARPFEHQVVLTNTTFRVRPAEPEPGIEEIYSQLAADEDRTALIVTDVLSAVQDGRSPLVLTERTEHLDRLAALLDGHFQHVLVLRGGMSARERKRVAASLKSIPGEESRVLVATGRYIGEGFDDARLDTLFLVLPVSWRGTIQQYAGRLHRVHASKRIVQVFDYIDVGVPMLLAMHKKRLRGYKEIGYSVAGEAGRGSRRLPLLIA